MLTPSAVRAVLAEHDLAPSRALGQHFLADPNTARRIVRLANITPGTRVLEVGPGIGSLTVALAEAGARVLALELDRHLVPALEASVANAGDVTIVVDDALRFDVDRLGTDPWVCVSNLPYNVATPVVIRLLEEAPQITRFVVMVQREVGERLAAAPGVRAAGAVSVKVAYYAEARILGDVPPTVFIPAPNVDSVLVSLDRRPAPPVSVPSPEQLFRVVRAGFGQRRKMLRAALRPLLGEQTEATLVGAGVAPTARAETLTLADWAKLTREVHTAR